MRMLLAVGTVLALGFFGCGKSVKDHCEDLCDKALACEGEEPGGALCVDECTAEVEDASDACQDAFGEFADCYDKTACDEVDEKCLGEAGEFFEKCGDDL